MNGLKYKEILKNNLLQYSNSFMPEEWIFQHENNPKHTLKVVKDWLASYRIQLSHRTLTQLKIYGKSLDIELRAQIT